MPRIDRPAIPDGYGIESAAGTLTWEYVETKLRESLHYWVATTSPGGRPHVVPRWGVWLDGAFWYDGSPDTRHVKNLTTNPQTALHLEDGASATIVYGKSTASEAVDSEMGQRLAAEFGRKYAPEYRPNPNQWSDRIAGGLRVIRPVKAIAWSGFAVDPTRFRFK